MLRVFFGENREAAEREIRRLLGEDYEVFEGDGLESSDLANIFQGVSLFNMGARKILLKNASDNSVVWGKIADYKDTEHDVIVWELKLDKRLNGYKALKDAGVELKEFTIAPPPENKLVFGILDLAFRDGTKAVVEVGRIEATQDPYMFFGLLVTQMLKRYEQSKGGARERKALKIMAETDLEMKTSSIEAWTLIKGMLIRISK